MSGRQGGKLKPLKTAKKADKEFTDVSYLSANFYCLCLGRCRVQEEATRRGQEIEGSRCLGRQERPYGWRWNQEVWQEISNIALVIAPLSRYPLICTV